MKRLFVAVFMGFLFALLVTNFSKIADRFEWSEKKIVKTVQPAQPAEKNITETDEIRASIVRVKQETEEIRRQRIKESTIYNNAWNATDEIISESDCLGGDRHKFILRIKNDADILELFRQLKTVNVLIFFTSELASTCGARTFGPCPLGSNICQINGKIYLEASTDAQDIRDYFELGRVGRK